MQNNPKKKIFFLAPQDTEVKIGDKPAFRRETGKKAHFS
jgi:hypothetical protein